MSRDDPRVAEAHRKLPEVGRYESAAEHQSFIADRDKSLQIAEFLRKAIALSEIEAKADGFTWIGKEYPPNTLIISVGRKPNRELETALSKLGIKHKPTVVGTQRWSIGGGRAHIPDLK